MAALPLRHGQGGIELLLQHRPPRQPGELIVKSPVAHQFLGVVAIGDVLKHAHEVTDLQSGVVHGGDAQLMATDLAAAQPVPDLALPEPALAGVLPEPGVEITLMPPGLEQVETAPQDLGSGIARDAGEALIGRQHPALGIGDDDRLGAGLEHGGGQGPLLIGFLGDRQGLAGTQVIRDQHRRRQRSNHCPHRTEHQHQQHLAGPAARTDQLIAELNTDPPASTRHGDRLVLGVAERRAILLAGVVENQIAARDRVAVVHPHG